MLEIQTSLKILYNSDYYDCLSDVEFDPGDVLSEKDYQEIYRTIIDDIKQQVEEWKIESEGTLTVIKHDLGKKHFIKKDWRKRNERKLNKF